MFIDLKEKEEREGRERERERQRETERERLMSCLRYVQVLTRNGICNLWVRRTN